MNNLKEKKTYPRGCQDAGSPEIKVQKLGEASMEDRLEMGSSDRERTEREMSAFG